MHPVLKYYEENQSTELHYNCLAHKAKFPVDKMYPNFPESF